MPTFSLDSPLLPTSGGAWLPPPLAAVLAGPHHSQVGEVEILWGIVLGPPDLPRWQHSLVHRVVREGRREVSHRAVGGPGGGGGGTRRRAREQTKCDNK